MPITLDPTPGGASANTYSTIVEADAHLESTVWFSDWDALSDEEKAPYLVRAAREIDAMGHTGYPTSDSQALQYPRYGQEHPSGSFWDSTAIPGPVKRAHAHVAGWLSSKEEGVEPFLHSTDRNVRRRKLVDVIGEVEYFAPLPPEGHTFLEQVIAPMLSQWGLLDAPNSVRLVR